ncbi:MAG: CARDB domain-containing protein [Pirellulales bacterium]
MKRSIKQFITLVAAVTTILGLSLPANAGKGGSFGGMSRGGSSGGMSRGNFGGGMARSMGSMGGRNVRSTGASGMSPRSFSAPARGMARPSLGHGTAIESAARHLNSSVSRSRGLSSLGHASNSTRSRSNVGSLGANRLTNVLGVKLGAKNSPIVKQTGIADRFKSGRISTRDVAKIDRNRLRDLVNGIEGGKSGRRVSGPIGEALGRHGKVQIADFIRDGHLQSFNPRGDVARGTPRLRSVERGLFAGSSSHDKNHCHDDHWLGSHLGGFWFDHGHNHHCYDSYDYSWQPYYTYSPCGVTFAAYPEVVTVAATQPIVIDQDINLESIFNEPEQDTADGEKPQLEVAGDGEDALADAAAVEATSEALASEEAIDDESTADGRADVLAGEAPEGGLSRDPAAQPEFDLELINVEMLAAGNRDTKLGPRFKVTVRNTGKRDLEKFLVSLVACKATQIDSSSLHASTTVERLAAGEETILEVTLPVEALSLNRDANGSSTPFNTLIAAVDSDERVNEGDEENNLALIDRVSIKLASR